MIAFYLLNGFSDASELAYASAVFPRMTDSCDNIYVKLVIAKTEVVPIKRLTVPCLELCRAVFVARLLNHMRDILDIPKHEVYTWKDSRINLSWLRENPWRFKVFVGNRVSEIMELIPTNRWHLCWVVVLHFWKRWTAEYISMLQALSKWKFPTNNLHVVHIICLKDETLAPTKWPLACIKEFFWELTVKCE